MKNNGIKSHLIISWFYGIHKNYKKEKKKTLKNELYNRDKISNSPSCNDAKNSPNHLKHHNNSNNNYKHITIEENHQNTIEQLQSNI